MEDPRIGQVLDNRYRVEERLAAGGMGVVYRAQRLGLAKSVAVKFLHGSSAMVPLHRRRFEREAAAMSRLTHPNLSTVIDYGSFEDVPYLVMEFHVGQSLRELLDAGPPGAERAVFIARQILAGLSSAHASGVIHRDLKPANIFLVGNPGEDLVKILDFGVAKLLEGETTEVSAVAGKVLGTPEYMSPEQAMGEQVDARSDVYSAGIVLYEMVTGRRPFEAEAGFAVLRKQVEDEPIRPIVIAPEISPQLDGVILRALEKDRQRRWQSAADLGGALIDVPEGRGRTATPGGQTHAHRRVRGRAADPPTIAASPVALGRTRLPDGAVTRGSRRWLVLLALAVAVVAGCLLADNLGWVDIPWPAWVPWAG